MNWVLFLGELEPFLDADNESIRRRRVRMNTFKSLVHGLQRPFGEKPLFSEVGETDTQPLTLVWLEDFVPDHDGYALFRWRVPCEARLPATPLPLDARPTPATP